MNTLRTVLMVTGFFPPLGGAGVQRTLKFVKYLPEFGWQPHVLTLQSDKSLHDPSLEAEVPGSVSITRTPILQLPSFLPWRVRNFISRWLFVVDEQVGWLPFAVRAGNKMIANEGVQAIYSSSAPYTDHLVARQLHRKTRLPWVADFRDPWIGNPFLHFPTSFHLRVNERLEHSVFTEANRVILNTEPSRQHYVHKYPGLSSEKFITLSNGYDRADFDQPGHSAQPNSAFTILHLGSLYRRSRSSESFLAALRIAISSGAIPPGRIHLRFIGIIDRETGALIDRLGLGECVETSSYLPHRQALSHLFEADLLLLIPHHGSGSELFVPAKLYEYLAARKPILCLADPGACADLVLRARAGSVVSPTDTRIIADELSRCYQQWERAALSIDPDVDYIETFERRRLTGRLAKLLNEVCL